ncbi:uncharacterized protein LOC129601366 [Paramacrobiotus metropolitanus]|uniref:uncharacterized protein LOC129601366 n=1 Tax=Paramacrobiotus metropolitanus TaxID=2943436 RepID=UPI0024455FC5|nr:uncharacterized protein LOC129601366 [Paramacrobiotus metropolitanus]
MRRRHTCHGHCHQYARNDGMVGVGIPSIVLGLAAVSLNVFALGMLWRLPHPISALPHASNLMAATTMVIGGYNFLDGGFRQRMYTSTIPTAVACLGYGIYHLSQYAAAGKCAAMQILVACKQCCQNCNFSCSEDLNILISHVFMLILGIHMVIGTTWLIACFVNFLDVKKQRRGEKGNALQERGCDCANP